MENTQLEMQQDSKGSKRSIDYVQFNVAISKTSKKQFLSFCLENDLVVKDAAENALLEFIKKHEA